VSGWEIVGLVWGAIFVLVVAYAVVRVIFGTGAGEPAGSGSKIFRR